MSQTSCGFSSSPPSSPSSTAIDSSPISTPDLSSSTSSLGSFIDLGPALIHPFAGVAKTDRRFKQHEYHPRVQHIQMEQRAFVVQKAVPRTLRWIVPRDDDFEFASDEQEFEQAQIQSQEALWDEAIHAVFDGNSRCIDLSNKQLTYIPTSIGSLAKHFIIPSLEDAPAKPLLSALSTFSRTSSSASDRAFVRSQSIQSASLGVKQGEIQILLASNLISVLPRQLFEVDKMTVLSIRNNKLKSIPHEINRLSNLRELNISLNLITYLPSEMMDMKLTTLMIHPNINLLPLPLSPSPSPTQTEIRHAIIPPLKEICLRLLMSPTSTSDEPLLNHYKIDNRPIPHTWGGTAIPTELAATLDAIVPGSMAASQDANLTPRVSSTRDREIRGKSICPNSNCRGLYVDHSETRISWEEVVAGCKVAPAVPVMWRGCSRGCLDFMDAHEVELDKDLDEDVMMMDEDVVFGGIGIDAGNVELGFDDGE